MGTSLCSDALKSHSMYRYTRSTMLLVRTIRTEPRARLSDARLLPGWYELSVPQA